MSDFGERFGLLQGKVDEISRTMEDMSKTQTIILTKLDGVDRDISIVKIVFKTLKWIGICLGALATFKLGDIHSLWDYIRS